MLRASWLPVTSFLVAFLFTVLLHSKYNFLLSLVLYGHSSSLRSKSDIVKNTFILVQPSSKESQHPSSPPVFSRTLASPTASQHLWGRCFYKRPLSLGIALPFNRAAQAFAHRQPVTPWTGWFLGHPSLWGQTSLCSEVMSNRRPGPLEIIFSIHLQLRSKSLWELKVKLFGFQLE